MKQLILRLAVPFAALTPIAAQAPPPQEAPNLLTLPTGEKLLSWQGHTGRSYFLQVSDPTSHLEKWFWAPVIEGGADAEISYEVDGTADKGFFRIHHTDQVPGAGETLDTADFDEDGIPNLGEISPGVGSATHPLKPDTDGDGLPDGWEKAHGLDPNDNGSIDPQNGASGMFQGGTVSNGSAFAQGVQANPNATPTDKDGDGLPNENDAEPDDGQINWKKTPEVRYVWIPQVEKTGATAVSRHGQILFPGYSDFVSTIKESEILWDSNTSDWVDMPANSSWSDSGLTLFNTSQVFDAAWDNITDMNDNGTVVGQSAFWNIDTGYNVPDSALMVWEMSGSSTNQYGSPTYLVPSSEYVTDGKILSVSTSPRIADDGTVSSESYNNVNFDEHFVWVVKKTEAGIHCNEMSEWLTLDIPSYGSYTGAILDHQTGLFVQRDSDPAKYFLHYRGGGDAESLEGLLANTTERITGTDIARTPAPEGSGQGRVWFSVKQDSGDSVFLEKRAGGSGVSRWHKPASMAEGAIRVNARGEAITPTKVWSNGTYTPINDLVAKPESSTLNITKLIDLASNGIILAEGTEDGVTETGLLLPMEVREAETESGFDDFPRSDPSQTPSHPWVMVPEGGTDENQFVLAGIGEFELPLSGTVPAVQLTPVQTGEEDPLTVTVSGDLSGDDEGVQINGFTRIANLAFYPKLTVDVKFFEVTLVRADGERVTSPGKSKRTGTKLRNYLNRVYGKQCNVFFNIADENTEIEVAYDVGDPDGRFAEYSKHPTGDLSLKNPGNDSLDCVDVSEDDATKNTTEEDLIRAAGWDANAVVNIYFLPRGASVVRGPVGVNDDKFVEASSEGLDGFLGVALREKKMILIPWVGSQGAGAIGEGNVLQIVAHEIGHMPLTASSQGLRHPRIGGEPNSEGFPLKTSELDNMRLMAQRSAYSLLGDPIPGRINPETNEPYVYLIKEEWDAIRGIITSE